MSQPDLSEFYRYSRPKRSPCRVGHARAQLKPAERAQLDAALEIDKGVITAGAIEQWLTKRGQDASITAIANHRKKKCTCYDAS
jgi:hypothetical protein